MTTEHRSALLAKAINIYYGDYGTLHPHVCARPTTVRCYAKPIPVVIVICFGKLSPMDPQLEPRDLKGWLTKISGRYFLVHCVCG
jgi:hypothetical protein